MRLTSTKVRGDIQLRRYEHDNLGTIETLSRGNLVVVRPVFGLLKPDKLPKVRKGSRGGRLGRMWTGFQPDPPTAA